ncbi:MAG: cytochrome c4 [Candidatus Thiodiazotropha taylori]|nr:cytochrome c4 [Candidatus Thiodiazotropha taylori]MCG7894755.1 cytochrome c4 [Candidatus Thiodiazotropha taylori]MCG7905122.1 cytochrome c4 [Candidatus Thiodiazotropha taylori]MCG7912232.1 cytochrome c4 [Candidatus Thiodiazotropha taylori]MCG7924054.1 cytochrome c4 [Candidatus Thiodiazotropha taylori]
MMKKKMPYLLLGLAVLFPATAAAAPTGQALAFTCAGCHGTDGSSVGPSSPSIAGMDPEVFIDAMQGYKFDERNSTIMNRIAKGYNDEQIKSMAWFFAKQTLRLKPQKYDAEMAKLGAKLHDEYCEKCHEDGGKPGDAGTLAGQWMPYLHYTMEDFIDGRREYPRKMRRKVDAAIEAEGDRAMPALIHYYGSQH